MTPFLLGSSKIFFVHNKKNIAEHKSPCADRISHSLTILIQNTISSSSRMVTTKSQTKMSTRKREKNFLTLTSVFDIAAESSSFVMFKVCSKVVRAVLT